MADMTKLSKGKVSAYAALRVYTVEHAEHSVIGDRPIHHTLMKKLRHRLLARIHKQD